MARTQHIELLSLALDEWMKKSLLDRNTIVGVFSQRLLYEILGLFRNGMARWKAQG